MDVTTSCDHGHSLLRMGDSESLLNHGYGEGTKEFSRCSQLWRYSGTGNPTFWNSGPDKNSLTRIRLTTPPYVLFF